VKRHKARRSKIKTWEANESSGLTQEEDNPKWERLVGCRLDRTDRLNKKYFSLSYFVRPGGTATASKRKAVLFCSGGPGELVQHNPNFDGTPATFLSLNQYDVVAFDLRGAGFSQLPPSSDFDKYLRTDLAIDDIEEIRRDWLGKDNRGKDVPWEAIVAKSYGSLLAQQYANKYPTLVKKLVLLAPISRHMFKESTYAYETLIENAMRIQRECLLGIYNSKEEAFLAEFGDLTADQKDRILDELFGNARTPNKGGVVRQIDEIFGNTQYVIDDYFNLKDAGVLKAYGLGRFSRSFFRALRELRLEGTFATKAQRDRPIRIGRVLRDNVLGSPGSESDFPEKNLQLHYRVLYGMWVHDGLDPKFLRALLANGGHVRNALMAIGGKAQIERKINRWLNKIQVDDRLKIKPWDPADYSHGVDTLILSGDADPVTCQGQAEHWFSDGLKGRRVLIKLPGVGHDIVLPVDSDDERELTRGNDDHPDSVLSGAIRVKPLRIQPGEILPTIGTANGLSLNETLHFKIHSGKLKERVNVRGEGIVINQNSNDVSGHIVMLIKNETSKELEMREIKDTLWPIECKFFSGIVQIDRAEAIPPKAVKPVYGTVIQAGRNEKELCKLRIDENLDELPRLLGFFIDGANVLLSFVNKGQRNFKARTIACSLSKSSVTRKFRVRIPDLRVEEAQDTSQAVFPEFRLEKEEEFDVVFPPELGGVLMAEVPQEATSDLIPIIIWVMDNAEKPLTRREMTLLVENTAFSLTVEVRLDEDIPIGGGIKVYASVRQIKWKKWLDIEKPDAGVNLTDPGVNLIGYNILSKDKILMFLQNQGGTELRNSFQDWIYFDPREHGNVDARQNNVNARQNKEQPLQPSGPANSLFTRKPLFNRLIYSFLVRGIEEFAVEKKNRVLKQVREAFGIDSVRFDPVYKKGDRK
jgi:pimeloyl-ACP methyl ester carboxylesterase